MSKTYNETGKRAEVIKQKTVAKSGFASEELLAEEIRRLVNENTTMTEMTKLLNIGKDAIKRIKNDYGIGEPDRAAVIRKGVQSKHGVDNVMELGEVRKKQKESIRDAFDERGEDIVSRRQETLRERTGFSHALQNPESMRKYSETCQDKYGVRHNGSIPGRSKQIYDQVTERNGGVHPMQETFHKRSKGEIEMFETLQNEFPQLTFQHSVRSLLGDGREIDIYIPELKLGIEYCGLFPHSEAGAISAVRAKLQRDVTDEEYDQVILKNKTRHYKKFADAKDNGIRLLTVWCYEWNTRKEQIIGFIRSKLHNNKRVVARKCDIVELSKDDACKFVNSNHIQQLFASSIDRSFGLTHDGELVAIMVFGRHQRNGDTVVLRRMCFKAGYTVVGAASKMFKHAQEEMAFEECITWSDNRWSYGEVYPNMGFVHDGDLPPDYFYMDKSGNPVAKQAATKEKIGASGMQTERERALEIGMTRVWDCGKIRWKWVK